MEHLEKGIRDLDRKIAHGKLVMDNGFIRARIPQRGIVALHIPTEHQTPPDKVLRMMRGGLRDLATRIEGDDSLSAIRRIVAASWIATRHPYILEQLGFHVDTEAEEPEAAEFLKRYNKSDTYGKGPATFVYISREELLNKYGNNA